MNWAVTILRKMRNKVASKFTHPDNAFFGAVKENYSIECSWSIDKDTINYLDENYSSKMILRALDRHGGSSIYKAVEVSTSSRSARIDLPPVTGTIDVELGFYVASGEFSILEASEIDFGFKIIEHPKEVNWFTNESENIHQEMYEKAIKNSMLMNGSENFISRAK